MKKPPYPALVKPDAVVLLPPEEPEERVPRGLWPEARRRPRWVAPLVIGVIFASGLGLGLRLASRNASAPPEVPEAFGEIADPGQAPGSVDLGAMEAAALPTPAPTTPEPAGPRDEPAASAPPPVARVEPIVERREPVSEPVSEPARADREELAAASPPPPEPNPGSAALDLAPAPVGRTIVQSDEVRDAPVRSPLALDPPARDPEVVREEARRSLSRGADRFASAIGQAGAGSAAALTGQMLASDAAARDLLRFVRASRPSAAVAGLGPVTLRDGSAQADATLQLEWRGDFGVPRRGQVRVRLLAREGDGAWSVAGAQPLDGSPR